MTRTLADMTPAEHAPAQPEDVKPGEVWLVRLGDGQAVGMREDSEYRPWCVVWDDRLMRIENLWLWDEDITLVSRLVPEQAPTHPTTLVTEDDYRVAPYGTVVWGNGPSSGMDSALEKYGDAWLEAGDDGTFTPRHMAAAGPHQVLRRGDVS